MSDEITSNKFQCVEKERPFLHNNAYTPKMRESRLFPVLYFPASACQSHLSELDLDLNWIKCG